MAQGFISREHCLLIFLGKPLVVFRAHEKGVENLFFLQLLIVFFREKFGTEIRGIDEEAIRIFCRQVFPTVLLYCELEF